ncbi:hypothetical protein F511_29183 [Dorcoceras hygrometricum]|uniref:Uncharacterized protein n=1 Tax=Dorcoceras hygrometricum TaxID=472368 RepID=A0A2Z7DGQ3_9LAMI|nr:hypothetical protein F511_29183 [Dorcoceras hygrometricum]
MVKMFKALESLGLIGFLGCTSAVYEEDVQEFFANARQEQCTLISTVRGSAVVISEEIFADVDGVLGVLVYCPLKKKYLKVEYRLLHDIFAKELTAKAGFYDTVTQGRLDLMVAIMGEFIPDEVFRAVQHGQRADQFCRFFEEGTLAEVLHSPSACEPIEIVYEESHPAQPDRSTSDSYSFASIAQTAAKLHDLVSNINSEKLQSQELLSSFKLDLNEWMKSLELSI